MDLEMPLRRGPWMDGRQPAHRPLVEDDGIRLMEPGGLEQGPLPCPAHQAGGVPDLDELERIGSVLPKGFPDGKGVDAQGDAQDADPGYPWRSLGAGHATDEDRARLGHEVGLFA